MHIEQCNVVVIKIKRMKTYDFLKLASFGHYTGTLIHSFLDTVIYYYKTPGDVIVAPLHKIVESVFFQKVVITAK